jgi:hypothetical protein
MCKPLVQKQAKEISSTAQARDFMASFALRKSPAMCTPSTPFEPAQGKAIAKPLKIAGAGEGIRTLDPNLGKVVLYP